MKIRALIFDDEESIRSVLKTILTHRNYEIFDFEDPSICPIYLTSECNCPFDEMCADIIITDIKMPYVNGLDFIKKQKAKGCKVDNIVIISAFMDEDIIEITKKLGCKALLKPFQIKDLYNILDEFEKNIDPERKLAKWEDIQK